MPQVQFSYPAKGIQITKGMPTPKKMAQLEAWYKEARKVIPDIPEIGLPDKDGRLWKEYDVPHVDELWIRRTYVNDIGERAYLVIARKISFLGR